MLGLAALKHKCKILVKLLIKCRFTFIYANLIKQKPSLVCFGELRQQRKCYHPKSCVCASISSISSFPIHPPLALDVSFVYNERSPHIPKTHTRSKTSNLRQVCPSQRNIHFKHSTDHGTETRAPQ